MHIGGVAPSMVTWIHCIVGRQYMPHSAVLRVDESESKRVVAYRGNVPNVATMLALVDMNIGAVGIYLCIWYQ